MVYVALTVAIFSAVTMCCVGLAKKQRTQNKYTSVEEEETELTRVEQTGEHDEHIVFEQEQHHSEESPAFTLDDSDGEEPPPQTEQADQTTPV